MLVGSGGVSAVKSVVIFVGSVLVCVGSVASDCVSVGSVAL